MLRMCISTRRKEGEIAAPFIPTHTELSLACCLAQGVGKMLVATAGAGLRAWETASSTANRFQMKDVQLPLERATALGGACWATVRCTKGCSSGVRRTERRGGEHGSSCKQKWRTMTALVHMTRPCLRVWRRGSIRAEKACRGARGGMHVHFDPLDPLRIHVSAVSPPSGAPAPCHACQCQK